MHPQVPAACRASSEGCCYAPAGQPQKPAAKHDVLQGILTRQLWCSVQDILRRPLLCFCRPPPRPCRASLEGSCQA